MGTLVEDAVQAVRNKLQTTDLDNFNVLAADLTADDTDTTVELADALEGITPGSYIGIGYEIMWVRSTASGEATVKRPMRGTSLQAHTTGDLVEVRPRFAKGLIALKLAEEIQSWPPDLFQVGTTTITAAAGVRGFSTGLTQDTTAIDILRVWLPDDSPSTEAGYRILDHATIRTGPAALTGLAIQLESVTPYATTLHVEYAKPFDLTPFTSTTDLVADVGLSASMFDVAWLGALRRLLSEAARTDVRAQDESRLAEEVPPGHLTQVRRDAEQEYEKAYRREVQRLLRKYPIRMG